MEPLKNDPARAQAVYDIVINILEADDFSKAEVIIGLLTIVATQYTDRLMKDDECADFIEACTQWINLYWHPTNGIVN